MCTPLAVRATVKCPEEPSSGSCCPAPLRDSCRRRYAIRISSNPCHRTRRRPARSAGWRLIAEVAPRKPATKAGTPIAQRHLHATVPEVTLPTTPTALLTKMLALAAMGNGTPKNNIAGSRMVATTLQTSQHTNQQRHDHASPTVGQRDRRGPYGCPTASVGTPTSAISSDI